MSLVKTLAVTAAASAVALTAVPAAAESDLSASVRMGITYEETRDNDGEIFMSNFGTRIKWSGTTEIREGLEGISYIELGLDADDVNNGESGANHTRELWAGVAGDFGTVKMGAQKAAFFDLISSHTDIAWWGSCWTQQECDREARVLKLNGGSGALTYAASVSLTDDADDDFADQIEFGANYDLGEYLLGVAASIQDDEGDRDGGTMIGLLASGTLGKIDLRITYQDINAEYLNSEEDSEHLTIAAQLGNAYVVHNDGNNGGATADYTTIGYTYDISDSALMYFEYQTIDSDAGEDDTIGRAVLKYDF